MQESSDICRMRKENTMNRKSFVSIHAIRLLAVTVVSLIFIERPLQAYADPGSGLLMWQVLAAVVIGAGYQVRRFVCKLRSFAANSKPKSQGAGRGVSLL